MPIKSTLPLHVRENLHRLGFECQGLHRKHRHLTVWANLSRTPHLVIELDESEVRDVRHILEAIWQAGRSAQAESAYHEWQKLEATFRHGRQPSEPGPFDSQPMTIPPCSSSSTETPA